MDREVLNDQIEEADRANASSPEEIISDTVDKTDKNIALHDGKQPNFIEDYLHEDAGQTVINFFDHVQDEAGADPEDIVESQRLKKIVNGNQDSNTLGLGRNDWNSLSELNGRYGDSFGEAHPSDSDRLRYARALCR